ncbi:hypothetical protein N798_16975 [Knoellia flava TL1]|uniref:Uncharacterized protein n=1 Tax=Knoellia flava TL1 TaxID=1385518 RepID=A0ABR4X9C4_9MICO|nr:hypothetical protein [Knoellia flava]KGN28832.1 hypothetical protein N798_16975 [Knoellia flava TL1]
MPGDPASLSALGASATRASRELAAACEASGTAYASLKDVWGTSTSVRVRKEGRRALDALTVGGRHTEAVGAALQSYAVELSALQARARAVLDEASAAGITVEAGRARLAWGVTGEADAATTRGRADTVAKVQAELDAVAAQHRRRRDRFLAEVAASTTELEALARSLRVS